MSHKLTDITLYYNSEEDFAKKFTRKQNVISDLYVQFLNGYKPPKTSRISVSLSNEDCIMGNFNSSILSVSASFDNHKYWNLSDNGQNLYILETVHRIALLCSEKYNWDKDIFLRAYDQVKQVNFKYEIEGKKKNSPDRKHKAALLIKKNESHTSISVTFYDKFNQLIRTIELMKSFQHEMFYGAIVKKHKWLNNTEFGLYTTNEEITIYASLDTNKSEICLSPKGTEKEVLEGFLERIIYREFNTRKDIIEWVNK